MEGSLQIFLQQFVSQDAFIADIAAGYCEFINNIKARKKVAFDLRYDLEKCAAQDVKAVNDSFFNILQPNIKYAGGAYWDFIDHAVPLTDLSLIEDWEISGFVLVKNIKRFLPYTTKSKLSQPPFFLYLYFKFPLAWYFRGFNLFLF